MTAYPWRGVLVTGASSGLGRALAEACAAPGVTLHLSGRDAVRLQAVVAACRARGAEVDAAVLDVTDAAAMAGQAPGPEGLRGRIAVIASIAAFVAAPGAPAYCASKAAVQRWAEALDGTERARGIRLHAVCPGYVRTPMTARNAFPMPFLMDAEEAARRSLSGIARGRVRVVYPLPLYVVARLVGALPVAWRNALFTRLPAKQALE